MIRLGAAVDAGNAYWREVMQKSAVAGFLFLTLPPILMRLMALLQEFEMPSTKTALAALDVLLWRWKSPLST